MLSDGFSTKHFSILVSPEFSSVFQYQIHHSNESDKEAGKKKPGTCLKFLVEFITKITKENHNPGKLNPKAGPF